MHICAYDSERGNGLQNKKLSYQLACKLKGTYKSLFGPAFLQDCSDSQKFANFIITIWFTL